MSNGCAPTACLRSDYFGRRKVSVVHAWLQRWAPLADWGVAGGTFLLALATAWLAKQARKEARSVAQESVAVADQVSLQREQMQAATVPNVYPFGNDGSRVAVLLLKNGGPGLALNVRGAVFFRAPPTSSNRMSYEVAAGTIASGDAIDARLEHTLPHGWEGVEGFVEYDDTLGRVWTTHFRFGHARGNQLVGFHEPSALVAEMGDPRERYCIANDLL